MQANHIICDSENPQPEGDYWCPTCKKTRHHSLYDSRSGWFYQVASEEELDEALNESDILKCDVCTREENNEADGNLG